MIADSFVFAFHSLRERKLRSWLTMIGIFIGVAAVVALISLGQGVQGAIDKSFASIGADKLFIGPKTGFAPPGTAVPVELTDTDLRRIQFVPGLVKVSGYVLGSAKLEYDHDQIFTFVAGFPTDSNLAFIRESAGWKLGEGRDLKSGDRFKAIIGYDLAHTAIFPRLMRIGDHIMLNGKEFEVVGINKHIGNPTDDTAITIPIDTFRTLFSAPTRWDLIIAQVGKASSVDAVAQSIERALRSERHLKAGNEDFTVQTPKDILESFNQILQIIQVVLVGIASISLVVGAVGIMNTMYTAVLQRTRDIGVMKAVGAKNSDILTLFLIESGFLGLAGGAIGVVLGLGISKAVEFIAINFGGTTLIEAWVSPGLIVGALAFSFVVGALSGLFPAIQASRQQPVDALRYE